MGQQPNNQRKAILNVEQLEERNVLNAGGPAATLGTVGAMSKDEFFKVITTADVTKLNQKNEVVVAPQPVIEAPTASMKAHDLVFAEMAQEEKPSYKKYPGYSFGVAPGVQQVLEDAEQVQRQEIEPLDPMNPMLQQRHEERREQPRDNRRAPRQDQEATPPRVPPVARTERAPIVEAPRQRE